MPKAKAERHTRTKDKSSIVRGIVRRVGGKKIPFTRDSWAAYCKKRGEAADEEWHWMQRYHNVLARAGLTGHDFLQTIDEVIALAMPHSTPGEISYKELDRRVAAYAAEWASRHSTEVPKARDDSYSVQQVLDFAGVSNRTLNRYCDRAQVKRPGVGKRNFRFPHSDVLKLLDTLINYSSSTSTRELCAKSRTQINK